MTYSQACIELVKSCEGCRLEAYTCPAGLHTIGYGSTNGVRLGMVITQEEAEARLARDLGIAAQDVARLVHVPLTQGQFDALCSFVFNVGAGKFSDSTMLKHLNAGDIEGAGWEFERWVFAKGERLPGLVARRKREAELFRS